MPKSDDYIVPLDPDDKGFTPEGRWQKRYEKQRERVEAMEENFLEELKEAFRQNRSKLAREFMEYGERNPEGSRAKSPTVWGGDVGADFTGFERAVVRRDDEDR